MPVTPSNLPLNLVSTLSTHNQLVLCKQILKPVWTYGIQLRDAQERATLLLYRDSKTKYSGTSLMHLGTSGMLTSMETSKWKWLRQKLDGSLGGMKSGFSITTTSKRSIWSTVVSYYEGLREQNLLSWYYKHYTQKTGQCYTTTQLPIVFGKLNHDTSAVCTANQRPMKHYRTN
jgi:hypothetical protein